ncbi:hypothetical protein I9189_015870 [Acinetobacter bereziniae]|uniref:hypothetical protein n=1 Tax=Acinetobacter bereziniae TaxID=106648 RepID=UPI0019045498|nr:hypothetical protein [Acinetobacter bereziniae]QQC79462.1 hypothetical protein I9192_16005 [Acinetobacter bereziniae]UUN92539.1 hypothetical protein I9189_015870 [Acinetobacter bereziniae]
MKNLNWYSFFWIFGILSFGSGISDMAAAGEINYKFLIFAALAFCAFVHGMYIRYKFFKNTEVNN